MKSQIEENKIVFDDIPYCVQYIISIILISFRYIIYNSDTYGYAMPMLCILHKSRRST